MWPDERGGGGFADGSRLVAIWFLPRDWVGVALRGNPDRPYLSREVRVGRDYKAIIGYAESYLRSELARRLQLKEADLDSPESEWWADLDSPESEWWSAAALFKGKLQSAKEEARRLMAQFARDDESRIAAAVSLCQLGLPATDVLAQIARSGGDRDRKSAIYAMKTVRSRSVLPVLLEIARNAERVDGDREVAIQALGTIGGREVLPTLCAMAKDPSLPEGIRHAPALAMRGRAEASCGPALLEALALARWSGSQKAIIEVLGDIKYQPAAARILELLKSEDDLPLRMECVKALAGMRYAPAISELRAILRSCPAPPPDSRAYPVPPDPPRIEIEIEYALLRLTGPWGEPTEEVRLLIAPPDQAIPGKPMVMSIYIENITDHKLDVMAFLAGSWIINGRRLPPRALYGTWIGPYELEVNDVWEYRYDLSRAIKDYGRYTVQYTARGAVSNTIGVDARSPWRRALDEATARIGGCWARSFVSLVLAVLGVCVGARALKIQLNPVRWLGQAAWAVLVSMLQAGVFSAMFLLPRGALGLHHVVSALLVLVGYRFLGKGRSGWLAAASVALAQRALFFLADTAIPG
jgi:HEAT repeat protein